MTWHDHPTRSHLVTARRLAFVAHQPPGWLRRVLLRVLGQEVLPWVAVVGRSVVGHAADREGAKGMVEEWMRVQA